MLLFYFVGHGYEDENSTYPNLLFNKNNTLTGAELSNNSRNLQDVFDYLADEKESRILLVIGEACNAPLDDVRENSLSQAKILKRQIKESEQYQNLFLNGRGTYIITSSRKGQNSYTHPRKGGLFTQAFVNALNTTLEKETPATLEEFLNQIPVETEEITRIEQDPVIEDRDRPGFFKRIVLFFMDRKTKRIYNRELRDGNLQNLDRIVQGIYNQENETADSLRRKFLQKKPVSFYVTMAILGDANLTLNSHLRDTGRVLIDYCTAQELYSGFRSERDYSILEKLESANAKHNDQLGIEEAAAFLSG